MQPVPSSPLIVDERPRIAPLPAPERPDPVRDRWTRQMRLAIEEAALATATGDVPVGALVLGPDGELLGRGRNVREAVGDPTGHAEVVAIREAARAVGEWRLSGCTLVVTLEPCTMCAGAIVLSRLDRVVYGALDPKAGAAGSLFDVIRDNRLNHRPEVVPGVLADDCTAQLRAFFDTQR
ncbi:nucleoside deaminase [Kitasatospora sp. NPDC002522]